MDNHQDNRPDKFVVHPPSSTRQPPPHTTPPQHALLLRHHHTHTQAQGPATTPPTPHPPPFPFLIFLSSTSRSSPNHRLLSTALPRPISHCRAAPPRMRDLPVNGSYTMLVYVPIVRACSPVHLLRLLLLTPLLLADCRAGLRCAHCST